MGGGFYGLTRLVETPCVTTEAVWIGIAGAIWVVGILFAILGRVVSREHTNKDAFLSVQKFRRSRRCFYVILTRKNLATPYSTS